MQCTQHTKIYSSFYTQKRETEWSGHYCVTLFWLNGVEAIDRPVADEPTMHVLRVYVKKTHKILASQRVSSNVHLWTTSAVANILILYDIFFELLFVALAASYEFILFISNNELKTSAQNCIQKLQRVMVCNLVQIYLFW